MNPSPCILSPLTVLCPRIPAPCIDGRIEEGEWARAQRLAGFPRADGAEAHSRTTVWLGHDDGYLYIACRCEEPNTRELPHSGSAYTRELWARDRVELFFDTAHDHVGYRRFNLAPFDLANAARGSCRISYREDPGSRWFHHEERDEFGLYFRYVSRVEEEEAWSFEMAIPFETLGHETPQPGAVWGVNLARYTVWPVLREVSGRPEEQTVLSPPQGFSHCFPLTYADLVFDTSDLQLQEADFGIPHFGANRATLRFKAPADVEPVLTASVHPRKPGRIIAPERETRLTAGTGGVVGAEATWTARHYDDANGLHLNVTDRKTGRRLWHATYDFGWEDGTLPLVYLHKGETDGVPADPDPADPDFLVKKAQFIAARQPRFHRTNTMQGAPSDFTLESADGTVRFNLMDPACLTAMAQYIHDLYDNDTDRLLGLMFFNGQPALMRANTAYDPGASGRLETLSLLRYGSGYCSHMSRVQATMLNQMEVGNTGQRHRARNFGIGGHALTLVEHRGGYAILDSKHCSLYYTLDNKNLATIQELREQPEIGRRSYPHYMPALMTFKLDHIPVDPLDRLDGEGLVWPEGAPVP